MFINSFGLNFDLKLGCPRFGLRFASFTIILFSKQSYCFRVCTEDLRTFVNWYMIRILIPGVSCRNFLGFLFYLYPCYEEISLYPSIRLVVLIEKYRSLPQILDDSPTVRRVSEIRNKGIEMICSDEVPTVMSSDMCPLHEIRYISRYWRLAAYRLILYLYGGCQVGILGSPGGERIILWLFVSNFVQENWVGKLGWCGYRNWVCLWS